MADCKQRLLDELGKDDWTRLDIINSDMGMWIDEAWKIRSTRERWATELYIGFVVDPVWDAPRSPAQAVRRIIAIPTLPGKETTNINEIASIEMPEQFTSQLMPFVYALNFYRRTQCVDV